MVLVVTASVSAATGLLAAAGGLVRAARVDAQASLKKLRDGGETSRTAHVILAAQCALTVILLVGAGVFIRTLANLRAVDPGFVTEGRVLADVAPGLAGYGPEDAAAYVARAVDALERVPGVRSVTYSSAAMGQLGNTTLVDVGPFEGAAASERTTGRQTVGPAFAATVGLRLLHGRDIASLDGATGTRVAVVNESFARHYFGEVDAVGRQFTLLGERGPHTIVGVAADARDRGVKSPVERVVYEAPFDHPEEGVTFTVRGDPNVSTWVRAVAGALRSSDAAVPVRGVRLAASDLDDALRRERVLGVLTAAFGALAVFLVSLGLYGTISGIVARRAPEIGIRMALGSSTRRVLWLVTGSACVFVLAGAGAGLLAAFWLERLVAAQLFGVSASDPDIALSVLALVAITAAAAAAWPARRAIRIDPSSALRAE
jgi:predicted permease